MIYYTHISMQTIMQVYAADPLWGFTFIPKQYRLVPKENRNGDVLYVCVGTFCYHHGPSL